MRLPLESTRLIDSKATIQCVYAGWVSVGSPVAEVTRRGGVNSGTSGLGNSGPKNKKSRLGTDSKHIMTRHAGLERTHAFFAWQAASLSGWFNLIKN